MMANAACSGIQLHLCGVLGTHEEAGVNHPPVLHHVGLILPTPAAAQPKTTNLQSQALTSTERRILRLVNLVQKCVLIQT